MTSPALRSKSWHEFTGPSAPRMDFVITLCDTLQGQICPDFGELAVTGAWPLPDPSKFTGNTAERATLLNELYASLRRRIDIFTALPFASLDRMAMKARLDEIGVGTSAASEGALTMAVGINGMGRIGRLALRAAMGGLYRAPDDPRADNRLDVVHVNEFKAAPPRPRICSNSTAFTGAGARVLVPRMSAPSISATGASGLAPRRQLTPSPGVISAAISCSNARGNS